MSKTHRTDSKTVLKSMFDGFLRVPFWDPFLNPLRNAFLPLLGRSKIAPGSPEAKFLKFLVRKWFHFRVPGRSPKRLFEGSVQKSIKSLKLLPVKHQRALGPSQKTIFSLQNLSGTGSKTGSKTGPSSGTCFFRILWLWSRSWRPSLAFT